MNAVAERAKDDRRAAEAAGDPVTLGLLDAVHDDPAISQRRLAGRLDIALGLANAYLKRCVRRGLVKVREVPPRRFAYYLTPQGLAEKTRLTAEFLRSGFVFYRKARDQYDALIEEARAAGVKRVALAGAGELAEVAMLCALGSGIEVAGVVDPGHRANRFRQAPLVGRLDSLPPVDAVLVTEMAAPQATWDRLAAEIGPARLFAPAILKIERGGADAALA